MPTHTTAHHSTGPGLVAPWAGWHSKVRIAVLTAALFMALC